MTTGEIARSLERIERGTAAIHEKLDARPTWEDLKRLETARDKELAEVTSDIECLQSANRKVAWTVVGAVLVALVSLVVGAPPVL